jgi:hypothetical protein
MSYVPGRLPPFFHLGTVLSVLNENVQFSPHGTPAQEDLIRFLHSKNIPAQKMGPLVYLREDYLELLQACKEELASQHPSLKGLKGLRPEDYAERWSELANRHGLYFRVRPIGVSNKGVKAAAHSHLV